jgi:glycosyltransferase involved in cell wall biosynthesis
LIVSAVLSVKDEVEIIEHTVAHLRRIGVDHIVVLDIGSTDGTERVLAALEAPDFEVHQLAECLARDEELALVRRCLDAVGADWAFFLDADEFWLPKSGSLRSVLAATEADLLTVRRHNVALVAGVPWTPDVVLPRGYDSLFLYVEPIPKFFARIVLEPTIPWIRGVPMPKFIARANIIEGIAPGGHDIEHPDRSSVPTSVPADLVVAHWRRWLELSNRGELEEEFDRQVISPVALRDLRRTRVVRSAAELLGLQTPTQSGPGV